MDKHEWSQEIKRLRINLTQWMETSDGKRGKTANYWINYVNMIHLYHEFSRSIRTGDLDLFIAGLPKTISSNSINQTMLGGQ